MAFGHWVLPETSMPPFWKGDPAVPESIRVSGVLSVWKGPFLLHFKQEKF